MRIEDGLDPRHLAGGNNKKDKGKAFKEGGEGRNHMLAPNITPRRGLSRPWP